MTTLSLDQIYERVTRFEDESPPRLSSFFFFSFLDSTTGPWRVAIVCWSKGKGNDRRELLPPRCLLTVYEIIGWRRLFPPLNEIIVDY